MNKFVNSSSYFSYILGIPILWFIVNYPIRAIFIGTFGDIFDIYSPPIQDYELIFSLIYSTIFSFTVFFTTISWGGLYTPSLGLSKNLRGQKFICKFLFTITIFVFLYRLYSGNIFGLNEDVDNLYNDFATNLIIQLDLVKWLSLVTATFLWLQTRDKEFLIIAIITGSMIISFAVFASSKGPIFQMVLFYLFVMGVLQRKPNWKFGFILYLLALVYGAFSYTQRQFSVVRGVVTGETFSGNLYSLSEELKNLDFNSFFEIAIVSIFNRLNYLDALVLAMRKSGEVAESIYIFGGISELGNLIPRFIWTSRPLINFNIYLSDFIWGYPGSISETPIGRIGEAALIFGWLGIMVAPIYGLIFSKLAKSFSGPQQPSRLALYMSLLIFMVWPDSHLVFLWKAWLTSITIIFGLEWVAYTLYPPYKIVK